jgi:hypothetical protein
MSTYVAIALISAATLLLEISFLRLFAVQQFYHFAFMAVSLALLGAGASGSLLSVWKRRWPPAVLCLLFGLATAGSYLIINYIPFDSFSIAWDGRQLLFLMIYFLSAALPFLFAGLIVNWPFRAHVSTAVPISFTALISWVREPEALPACSFWPWLAEKAPFLSLLSWAYSPRSCFFCSRIIPLQLNNVLSPYRLSSFYFCT